MISQIVPLAGTASQSLSTTLGNQPCSIDVFTKHIQVPVIEGSIISSPPAYEEIDPVFINLRVNDVPIVLGVLARNNVRIVRNAYFGFIGDLSIADTEGSEDPQWEGLGQRWKLLYWPDLNPVPDLISRLYLYADDGVTLIVDDNGQPILR